MVNDVLQNGNRFYKPPPGDAFMPIEFGAACYRFGHSMVRPSYRANFTSGAGVGWQTFFDFGDGQVKTTRRSTRRSPMSCSPYRCPRSPPIPRQAPRSCRNATARQILASASDRARVIMLTTFDLDEYVYDALKAGASGFLRKDAPPERLLTFVRSAGEGDALLDPTITRRLIERFAPAQPSGAQAAGKLAELTPREIEVLSQVARGHSNAKIAADMYLSEATVKTHVSRILAKLDLRDRVQAVVLAYEEGLVQPGATDR